MRIYIDGYNLLFRLSKNRSLEETRNAFISSLNQLALQLHLDIIVVFDATLQKEKLGIVRSHYDALEIVYTENQDADSYILAEIERAQAPSQISVVTSDRELFQKAERHGASSQTIDTFIEWIKKKKNKQHRALTEKEAFQDSPHQIDRLLKIFTSRLIP